MAYGDLQIFSYLVVSLYLFFALRKKCKLKTVIISILIICVSITAFARLFWVLENYKDFASGKYDISDIFKLKLGAFKIIGVLIGAVVGTVILSKIFKNDKKAIIDASTEAMFLGAAYTKVVCTIVGCCLGKKTNMPWAISYPERKIFNLHPTTLYEVIVWLGGFALLHLLKNKIKNDSSRISIAVIYYVLLRMFVLEGLYLDGRFLGSPVSRIVYLIVIAICLAIIIKNKKKASKDEKCEE